AAVDAAFHFTVTVPFGTAASGVTPVIARVATPDGKSAADSIRIVRFTAALTGTDTFPAANATAIDAGGVLVVLFSDPPPARPRPRRTLACATGPRASHGRLPLARDNHWPRHLRLGESAARRRRRPLLHHCRGRWHVPLRVHPLRPARLPHRARA